MVPGVHPMQSAWRGQHWVWVQLGAGEQLPAQRVPSVEALQGWAQGMHTL